MGGWLWKIYENGNIDILTLQDHHSHRAGGSHLSGPCKDSLKLNSAETQSSDSVPLYIP